MKSPNVMLLKITSAIQPAPSVDLSENVFLGGSPNSGQEEENVSFFSNEREYNVALIKLMQSVEARLVVRSSSKHARG